MKCLIFLSALLFFGFSLHGITQDDIYRKNLIEKSSNSKVYLDNLQKAFEKSRLNLPPEIPEIRKKVEDGTAELGSAEKKNLSQDDFREISTRYDKLMQQLSKINGIFRDISNLANRYPLCLESDFYKEYLKVLEKRIDVYSMNSLKIISRASDLASDPAIASAGRVRVDLLTKALSVLQMQREFSSEKKKDKQSRHKTMLCNLPETSPLLPEFKAFCEAYLKNISARLNLSSDKKQKYAGNSYDSAYLLWLDIFQIEAELHQPETQNKDIKETDNWKECAGIARNIQDTIKKIISMSLKSDETEKKEDAELVSMKKELNNMKITFKASLSKLRNDSEKLKKRKAMDGIIKNCPEIEKTNYPVRFNELLEKIDENTAFLAKALSEKRRVIKTEAECRKQMLDLELEFLIKEASIEAYFLKLQAKRKDASSEDQKKLDISIVQYREAFQKLKKAKLEKNDLENRLKMLELKSEILENEMDALEENYENIRSSSEEFFSSILSNGIKKTKSRDIEDAEKISNENPLGVIVK